MHEQLVMRLTEYFDLCDLANAWSQDRETKVDIAGIERTFTTYHQVESHRDAARNNLRGYCNVLRNASV